MLSMGVHPGMKHSQSHARNGNDLHSHGIMKKILLRFHLPFPYNLRAPDRPFKRKVAEYNTWFQQDAAAQSAAMRGKIVCDLDCANYTLSNNHKLMIAMLLDGENGALTKKQIFHDDDGAWIVRPILVFKA